LERIADHTVNIAERVHYVETGIQVQLAPSHRSNS
jgi:phosphate uptake regulator